MDLETTRFIVELVVGGLVTPLAIVMWFLMRKMMADLATLEKAMADFQLQIALNYVQKDDFNKVADAIFKKLDRIEDFVHENRPRPNGS